MFNDIRPAETVLNAILFLTHVMKDGSIPLQTAAVTFATLVTGCALAQPSDEWPIDEAGEIGSLKGALRHQDEQPLPPWARLYVYSRLAFLSDKAEQQHDTSEYRSLALEIIGQFGGVTATPFLSRLWAAISNLPSKETAVV